MQLEIETQRTILRLIKKADLNLVAELNLDPEVRKCFPDDVQTKEQTMDFLAAECKSHKPVTESALQTIVLYFGTQLTEISQDHV